MGTYLGSITRTSNGSGTFFNFKPLCQVEGNSLISLSRDDVSSLLPASTWGNVNFFYDFYRDANSMDSYFPTDISLVICEFEPEDIQEGNSGRYAVHTMDYLNDGLIYLPHDAGFYQVVPHTGFHEDFRTARTLHLKSPSATARPDEKILVRYEDVYLGPYLLKGDSQGQLYIQPELKSDSYVLQGFQPSSRPSFSLYDLTNREHPDLGELVYCDTTKPTRFIDLISEEGLLKSFTDVLSSQLVDGKSIQLTQVEDLLTQYTSPLVAGDLPDDIGTKRKARLAQILTAERNLGQTLNTLSDQLCTLLSNHGDSQQVATLVETLLERNPSLASTLPTVTRLQEKVDQLSQAQDQAIPAPTPAPQPVTQTAEEVLAHASQDYKALLEKFNLADDLQALIGRTAQLEQTRSELSSDIDSLTRLKIQAKSEIDTYVNAAHNKMVGIAFDGFLSNKMLTAAAQWEAESNQQDYAKSMLAVNQADLPTLDPKALTDYLCQTVQVERPQYDRNTILNIVLCLSQSFLTVFSGDPGCGKTSICTLVAKVLGLNHYQDLSQLSLKESACNLNRFVPISVERGWTSKRDFVGYFNPLSKTFDKSNQRMYDALKLLDMERSQNLSNFPYLVLLDEANLSPMEYYWADFMNICDDLDENSQVNLGEGNVFSIPETLHFMATINNDHTTETLSPRLVDRSWVITLPRFNELKLGGQLKDSDIQPVSWASIQAAFLPPSGQDPTLPSEAQSVYTALITALRKGKVFLSPRTEKAIYAYCQAAATIFEADEYGTSPDLVALDYAVAQKILPKLAGNGDDYADFLTDLKTLCANKGLNRSRHLLEEMLDRGNAQMKYYQFF